MGGQAIARAGGVNVWGGRARRALLGCSVAYYIACYNAIKPPSDATVTIAMLYCYLYI